jgi:hypothetical protein
MSSLAALEEARTRRLALTAEKARLRAEEDEKFAREAAAEEEMIAQAERVAREAEERRLEQERMDAEVRKRLEQREAEYLEKKAEEDRRAMITADKQKAVEVVEKPGSSKPVRNVVSAFFLFFLLALFIGFGGLGPS